MATFLFIQFLQDVYTIVNVYQVATISHFTIISNLQEKGHNS